MVPKPEVHPVQPETAGQYLPCNQGRSVILEAIDQGVAAGRGSMVSSSVGAGFFAEFVEYALDDCEGSRILMLPAGTRLNGDLLLDADSAWCQTGDIAGIACLGDLHVSGDIVNLNVNQGPLLFVAGNVYVGNLIKGGAPVVVLGNLTAQGIVVAEYNDGVARIGGDVTAHAVFLLDHDFNYRGAALAPILGDMDDLRAVLVAELYDQDDEDWPGSENLWGWQRAGKPLFQPGCRPPNGHPGME